MIPGTAIPTPGLATDDSVQPVRLAQAVADLLSEFSPGQRLVATIQSQLPNGTYRAMIAQRDVTLALPFAAKSGDTLELEVVENQGRMTFAVVAGTVAGDASKKESVTATLSQTAQLISTLLPRNAGKESQAPPAPLNAGQPLLPKAPNPSSELPSALFKAVSESGVFYESHQAAWVNGAFPKAALLAEPQGRLMAMPGQSGASAEGRPGPSNAPGGTPGTGSAAPLPPSAADQNPPALAGLTRAGEQAPTGGQGAQGASAVAGRPSSDAASAMPGTGAGQPALPSVPAEIAPLVQQQLQALASNVYAWHGAAWPGQNIEWEIVDEDAQRQNRGDPDSPPQWQTRLRLSLPSLGAVDATLTLRGEQVDIGLVSRREDARRTMQRGALLLHEQFAAAGLRLGGIDVSAGEKE